MKAVVIGGYGKIGTYLVPKLVNAGYDVVAVSRGVARPYKENGAFAFVENLVLDREKLDQEGTFARKIAELNPDIVIDLINFKPESTYMMHEALKNTNIRQYLFCASIWVHGHATVVPATEDLPRYPIEQYGKDKAASEAFLHKKHRLEGFPETVVCPGHITGAGWTAINPQGNLDNSVYEIIGRGEKLILPNMGMECLHHVHPDDVAQVFMKSIIHREQAIGETFHATAPAATTMLGLAEYMYRWFGKEPNIGFLPFDEWCKFKKDPGFIGSTTAHVMHSDNYSIEKGRRLIDYQPRYTIQDAVIENVESLIERKVIAI